MVVNKSKQSSEKKDRVKVGKLKLNKETVKNLTGSQERKIKGGAKHTDGCTLAGSGNRCDSICCTPPPPIKI